MKKRALILLAALGLPALADTSKDQSVPVYRVTVVGRTTKAVNYGHRSGPTRIGFQGTVLMPKASGEATVESRRGAVLIEAKFKQLQPPTRFGREYLTYVLWALTPEGRATNLGEIFADDSDEGKLKVATELQAFALIVTAEPYFAVTQPSDVVVMENVLRKDTAGKAEFLNAKYELLPRGHYTYRIDPEAAQRNGEKKVSLSEYEALLALYQARNAIQIATSLGAGVHATSVLKKAEQLLAEAEDHQRSQAGTKLVVMTARQAAQTAEDARAISLKRQEQARPADPGQPTSQP